jgi:hypothetical protein
MGVCSWFHKRTKKRVPLGVLGAAERTVFNGESNSKGTLENLAR